MYDLFDPVRPEPAVGRPKHPPKKPVRNIPVVHGGLFALNDHVTPERYAACYFSGATAYYDAKGLSALGKDIGVAADELQPRVIHLLREYVRVGGKCFCDSGAFGVFRSWINAKASCPEADFPVILAKYDRLIEGMPKEVLFNFALVMPDVVSMPERSLELLQIYRDRVLGYIDAGVNAIVPLQKGPVAAGRTAEKVFEILGTRDITFGIPSQASAMELSDVATIRHDRFHILGRGAMGMPLFRRTYSLLEHNVGAYVSCDANQLRSHTACISYEQSKLIEENAGAIWESEFDDTEMTYDILHVSNWMNEKTVKAIASSYGVGDSREAGKWVKAHREAGLADLIEERDPECMYLCMYILPTVFGKAARAHLSARMRAEAVIKVFSDAP